MSLLSSLDYNGHSPNYKYKDPWTRQQKRAYQRSRSVLTFWLENGYKVLWLTLTSSPDSDFLKMAYNFDKLRKKIERHFNFRGLEFFRVKTAEGHGVFHVLLAWKKGLGERDRAFYIPQKWLSKEWGRIHQAPVVDVRKVRNNKGTVRNLTKYLITQYVTNQKGFINIAWSWKRSLGLPLGRVWKAFWRTALHVPSYPAREVIKDWELFLCGQKFYSPDGTKFFSFQTVRMWFRWQYKFGNPKGHFSLWDCSAPV